MTALHGQERGTLVVPKEGASLNLGGGLKTNALKKRRKIDSGGGWTGQSFAITVGITGDPGEEATTSKY